MIHFPVLVPCLLVNFQLVQCNAHFNLPCLAMEPVLDIGVISLTRIVNDALNKQWLQSPCLTCAQHL